LKINSIFFKNELIKQKCSVASLILNQSKNVGNNINDIDYEDLIIMATNDIVHKSTAINNYWKNYFKPGHLKQSMWG
jgi:hypothetical protein